MSHEIEFLRRVERGDDMIEFMRKHDIGYGWAIEDGLITKHPAWFEFYLTNKGRDLLAAQNTHMEQRTDSENETETTG